MQVKPNTTIVRGTVRSIEPQPDGWGMEITLEVERNESPAAAQDFLRPAKGSLLKVFCAEQHQLRVSDVVVAELRLNAGPTGGRTLLQAVKQAPR